MPESKRYKRIALEKTFVREIATPDKATPGWSEETYSWSDLYQDFKAIDDEKTNELWASLDKNVRSIISDDQYRQDGVNSELDRDSGQVNIYRVLLDEEAGARSYVSPSDPIVQLYPDVRVNSIAHEIGHVLGFMDHYYTRYDDRKCEYTTQSNDADLMSNPNTGIVLPEEWAELESRYPMK